VVCLQSLVMHQGAQYFLSEAESRQFVWLHPGIPRQELEYLSFSKSAMEGFRPSLGTLSRGGLDGFIGKHCTASAVQK
jgi:hypothetical protein